MANRDLLSCGLREGAVRLDGRGLEAWRDVSVHWLVHRVNVSVLRLQLGNTMVHVSTRGRVSEPPSERANEGLFGLHVTRLARAFETSESQAKAELHFTRVLRSIFVRGRVLDTSDLCIIPGKKVWSISTSVSLLQDDGNAIDALAFAILVSLFHFRRSSVQLVVPPPSNDARLMPDSSVRLCPPVERPPLSLSLSYLPITSTLALLSPHALLDPLAVEEDEANRSLVTFCVDATSKDLTACFKDGLSIDPLHLVHHAESAYLHAIQRVSLVRSLAPPV